MQQEMHGTWAKKTIASVYMPVLRESVYTQTLQSSQTKILLKACAGKAVRGAGKKKRVGRPYQHEKWMLAVLNRDKKCVRCGAVENLQAHHLKSWKSHPALRDDISNGVALCVLCHHAQHPKLPLETFVASGGKSVQYCVVCEDGFVVRRKTQRTCSQKCGRELRKQRQPA